MSDGESVKHSSYTGSPSSDATSGEASQQQEIRDEESVSFDLSDPSDMERKLEDLSEQEIDELLKQAYKVNSELKKELQRQERATPSAKLEKSMSKTKLSSGKSGSDSASSLPPIRNPSGNKPLGPRGFTTLNHRTNASLHTSSPVNASMQKAKTAIKQPSAKSKPGWDDRFGL